MGEFLDFLFMVLRWLPLLLLIGCFVSVFLLEPKLKKKHENTIFDNQVLGFIDGIYMVGFYDCDIKFYCTHRSIRNYVIDQLAKAHKLPGNQFLIEYTTAGGFCYRSHTGNGDHMLFAILCIAQYATDHGHANLIAWAESKMASYRKESIYL